MAQKQRDPWTDPESMEQKKNIFLFVFLGGFAWTFPESKWGMDFLGNQTGIAQTWESNGGLQQNKKIIT